MARGMQTSLVWLIAGDMARGRMAGDAWPVRSVGWPVARVMARHGGIGAARRVALLWPAHGVLAVWLQSPPCALRLAPQKKTRLA